LVVFGGAGAPLLAWHLTYAASSVGNHHAVNDADTGQLLHRQDLTKVARGAHVWTNSPGAANGGSVAAVDLDAATTASPTGYLNPAAATLTRPNEPAPLGVDVNHCRAH